MASQLVRGTMQFECTSSCSHLLQRYVAAGTFVRYGLTGPGRVEINVLGTYIGSVCMAQTGVCGAILQPTLSPTPFQVILTIIISYIVDTFVSQYRLSEKLRETLKKNHEEQQPEEGLIAFCAKQAQSGSSVGALTACYIVPVTWEHKCA